MRLIGYTLAACVALALLQAVATVLVLAMIGAAVCALIFRPAETLMVGCLLLFAGLAANHPTVLIALVAVIATACLIAKAIWPD
ncbi:hypothetical protein [Sphingomonas sp.]|uniref:hypothetical protein n=1 Tax=Sphingomonas sp. TaxID=28214 RepID=UPI003F72D236